MAKSAERTTREAVAAAADRSAKSLTNGRANVAEHDSARLAYEHADREEATARAVAYAKRVSVNAWYADRDGGFRAARCIPNGESAGALRVSSQRRELIRTWSQLPWISSAPDRLVRTRRANPSARPVRPA
jgi:hypothetical protein